MQALERYEMALASPEAADWAEIASELAAALYPRQKREPSPASALAFLRAIGGVWDNGGDLRRMDAHRFPGLVSRRGLTLDAARARLVEAGYLRESGPDEPPITTVNDVIEIIRDGLAGRHTYPYGIPF